MSTLSLEYRATTDFCFLAGCLEEESPLYGGIRLRRLYMTCSRDYFPLTAMSLLHACSSCALRGGGTSPGCRPSLFNMDVRIIHEKQEMIGRRGLAVYVCGRRVLDLLRTTLLSATTPAN